MNKIYAGIGSRETPFDVLKTMERIGKHLAIQGWTLRSGGAVGADSAFEKGCNIGRGVKEIFYANNNRGTIIPATSLIEAEKIASSVHPAWDRCNEYARKLHTRNVAQILGKDLNTPVDFVVCWTKEGKKKGGTATAMNVAEQNGIRIYNLFFKEHLQELREMFK